MSTRICKVCNIKREYRYLALDNRSRSVYKDETGKLWHGRTCGSCQLLIVKKIVDNEPLGDIGCKCCGKIVKQKNIKQFTCSKECYKKLNIV